MPIFGIESEKLHSFQDERKGSPRLSEDVCYEGQAIGESITCIWTGSAWAITAYGAGKVQSDVVGTQDVS